MIEDPQIVTTEPQMTAILHLTVPRNEIGSAMGAGVAELRAAVAAQGVTITGPWFTHHLTRPTDTFDFEICVPVAAPVVAAGRVRPSEWPAMKVARTLYHGSYEGLPAAWGEFESWIAAHGLHEATDLWERYVVNPDTSPDPTTWRTELNRPLYD